MKKSIPTQTPKELMQKRVSAKIMRLSKDDGGFNHNANKLPEISLKNRNFRKHEKELGESPPNPFRLPDHMQTFPRIKKPIKSKRPKNETITSDEVRTVCDIDESFYDVIKGRPLKTPGDFKTYIRHLRAITLYRTDAGFLTEQMASIDHAFAIEMEEYENIYKFYEETKWNYIRFIKHIYKKSKMIQLVAEKQDTDIAEMNEKLETYSFEYVKTRNMLQNVVARYETRAVYARFLNFFTPEWWRNEFESAYRPGKGQDYRIGEYEDVEAAKSETDILQEYKIALIKPNKRKRKLRLYFMQPAELMDIFEYIEQQCKIYIHIDGITSSLRMSIVARRDVVKEEVNLCIEELQDYIDHVKKKVLYWEEAAEAYRAAFLKILKTEFKNLFASHDNVKLFNCLRYAHSQMFGDLEDAHDSVETLMHDIENMYMEVTLALDELDQQVVKVATREFFAEDIKVMTRAQKAYRELKEANLFRKSLYASFEPSRKKNYCK